MGKPIDQQKLNELIDACWAHHAWVKGLRCNCNFEHPDPNDPKRTLPNAEFDRILPDNEIPILWFGDMKAYDASPRKIVTVGLNPSDMEFSKTRKDRDEGKSDMFRFEEARSLSGRTLDHLNEEQRDSYKRALNRYFAPKERKTKRKTVQYVTYYKTWFNTWNEVLRGLNAVFIPSCEEGKIPVIHTDFITPVATTPAWSKLGERKLCVRDAIEVKSRKVKLWKQLMEILEPDLILAAVAGDMAKEMAADLETITEEQPAFSDQNKKRKWTLAETNVFGKRSLFVNVPPQRRTPFSCWSKSAKFDFGENICLNFNNDTS